LQNIPVPGINLDIIRSTIKPGSGLYTIAGLISMFSGSSLLNFSVLALGLFPFNFTSRFLPWLIPIVPYLQDRMVDDLRSGQRWFEKWTYYLSIPMSVLMSYNFIKFLNRDDNLFISEGSGAFSNFLFTFTAIATLTAGSFFAVWIAELISKYGIKGRGNDILLISGIIGGLPQEIGKLLSTSEITESVGSYIVIFVICIVGVIYLLGGSRNVSVMYAQKSAIFYTMQRGKSVKMPQPYLPLKLEIGTDGLAGSQLLLSFAGFCMFLVSRIDLPWLNAAALWVIDIFREDSLLIGPLIFLSVVAYTFFSSDVLFSLQSYGENLKRSGAQIPGVHSGKATEQYLRRINSRIVSVSAVILGALAIAPWIFNIVFDTQLSLLDGEKLIIIVGVIISILEKFKTEMK